MIDPKLIRTQPDKVRGGLSRRQADPKLVDDFLALDEKRKKTLTQAESAKQERNQASEKIGRLKKEGRDTSAEQDKVRKIHEAVKKAEAELSACERRMSDLILSFPNLPHPSVPDGRDPSQNQVVKTSESGRQDVENAKPHWEIAVNLGLIDFARAAKISGAMFSLFTGTGARLQRGLIQFMLDFHIQNHGYTEVYPPFLVRPEMMLGTGQLPKFAAEMYRLEADDLFLIPTAEVPVTNLHRDEILSFQELPKKYVAYTACFRREAGAAGAETRGLQRLHQFDKVELVKLTAPESSYDEHEKLLQDAEGVLKALDLRYRVVLLCSGDTGFAAAKCYDLETWCPSRKKWLEVSSCSNFEDFQARRSNLRFRREARGKPEFLHTLNASGLALPRVVISILENYQNPDGSVAVPEKLRSYMGGLQVIS